MLRVIIIAAALICQNPQLAPAGETLDAVRERGFVRCGVSTGLPGFSSPDETGNWRGIDVDVCRAVAAAVFGDAAALKIVSTTTKNRFLALQSGEVDLLSRNTTWTLTRDSALGLDFVGVVYYDGQGFLVPTSLGAKSAVELNGTSVCVASGSTSELNVADYFRTQGMSYEPISFESINEIRAAYEQGRCDVLTSDMSALYAIRSSLTDPDEHVVLPEIISKEPLGPVVRHGDNQWGDVVRWSLYVMLEAEELGVSSKTVGAEKASSSSAQIRRLLGVEGDIGQNLGLPVDFGYQIVAQVGSYEEVFERNLGAKTPLHIPRGVNALWTEGGLQYAMPVR
jgi:general L-amino acid transport system substrate-binding protein